MIPNCPDTDFPWSFAVRDGMTEEFSWENSLMKIYYMLGQDHLYANAMKNVIFLDNYDMSRIYEHVNKDVAALKWPLLFYLLKEVYRRFIMVQNLCLAMKIEVVMKHGDKLCLVAGLTILKCIHEKGRTKLMMPLIISEALPIGEKRNSYSPRKWKHLFLKMALMYIFAFMSNRRSWY